jgi:endoglucanase
MLILVEGIQIYPKSGVSWSSTNPQDYDNYWWGGNLKGVADHPVNLGEHQGQLLYSPHDYGPAVSPQPWFEGIWDRASLEAQVWDPYWLYIHKQGIAPLLIGEWGGFMDGGANQKWMTAIRDLIVDHRLHHTFWVLNPNSGDTGGLLTDDWATWDEICAAQAISVAGGRQVRLA